jgi:hypothetical protein
MLFRPVRGLLAEAMREVRQIPATRAALAKHLSKERETYIDPLTVEVKAYGYDPRIDWHTWIVTVNGDAAGYTDQGLDD